MDQFDRASEVEQRFIQSAIARAQAGRKSGESCTHCEECGEAIPEARRKAIAGCRLCIDCQTEQETAYGQNTTWNS
ncbi:TraR/DksA C4-type zinc finger protein [Halodesulfovibrio aestuarii]|uniref:TraR/DksA C4-type zinc finger protein n=1 Tax=Halodesulfovibrio aestuarii TaxID=126333 RepID=A0ABV4JR00_9BACT